MSESSIAVKVKGQVTSQGYQARSSRATGCAAHFEAECGSDAASPGEITACEDQTPPLRRGSIREASVFVGATERQL